MKKIIETKRLYMREMTQDDFDDLCKMLKDKDVMYAYEHAFDDEEAHEWLDRQIMRYRKYGFGLWAVILKETDEMIGQCGITMQDCGGEEVAEVGYLFCKEFWHQGYATESAVACKKYAFDTLGFDKVYSIIRDNNIASQNVAKRNAMKKVKTIVKHYYNMDMPHFAFCAEKNAMRRREREITEKEKIEQIIKKCSVCRIGMCDDEGIYIVPMNFGYTYDEKLTLYFHCANDGRKLRAIKDNPDVALEMDISDGIVGDEKACTYTCKYKSVMAWGKAKIVDETQEKISALKLIMKHQTGRSFDIQPDDTAGVTIFKITAERISAKGN